MNEKRINVLVALLCGLLALVWPDAATALLALAEPAASLLRVGIPTIMAGILRLSTAICGLAAQVGRDGTLAWQLALQRKALSIGTVRAHLTQWWQPRGLPVDSGSGTWGWHSSTILLLDGVATRR